MSSKRDHVNFAPTELGAHAESLNLFGIVADEGIGTRKVRSLNSRTGTLADCLAHKCLLFSVLRFTLVIGTQLDKGGRNCSS